ncbi:MAG: fibrobacter succinogenes major paralogous domain-containing protein [Bacteroidales bacterium]|nr:fibrobacter succinogenes major paralogous domain-containing protein [Bacteroidales bacterium]
MCGLPFSDTRDGQVYTTVLIGTQCWMAENLNIGIFISGSCEQYDNGIIEKYCYGNNEANCDEYGGLYSWDEVMQYSRATGAQGICPDGWHVPTDEEWCILEQHVDTSISCALFGWRGETGGGALKETGLVHWLLPNTNASNTDGFNALPGGGRGCSGRFTGLRSNGRWWTSNCFTWVYACDRGLSYCNSKVRRDSTNKKDGFSVRCLKD